MLPCYHPNLCFCITPISRHRCLGKFSNLSILFTTRSCDRWHLHASGDLPWSYLWSSAHYSTIQPVSWSLTPVLSYLHQVWEEPASYFHNVSKWQPSFRNPTIEHIKTKTPQLLASVLSSITGSYTISRRSTYSKSLHHAHWFTVK